MLAAAQSSLHHMKAKSEPGARCHIRQATSVDYSQIAALEARYGMVPKPYEEWIRLWQGNPAYGGLTDWSIGWVVETSSGQIVGHIANIPTHLEFQGRRLLAASGSGLVVDERYRSYALPLFGEYCTQSQPDLFLNTSVNANGMPLHQLFHFLPVPSGAWNRSSFWVTDYTSFASRMLRQKRWSSLLRYPVAGVLAAKDAIRPRVHVKVSHGREITTCHSFHDGFEEFWQTRSQSSSILLGVRSSATLEWHFKPALDRGMAFIVTMRESGRLLAYAVFLRQDNREVQLNRMRLVDFQSLDGDPEHLAPMIAFALQKCRSLKMHMLEAIGFASDTQRVLSRIAPHQRELPCWLYFYKANKKDPQLVEQLKDSAAWDPSSFDGDGSL
jgi:hypothetical protein